MRRNRYKYVIYIAVMAVYIWLYIYQYICYIYSGENLRVAYMHVSEGCGFGQALEKREGLVK